MTARRRPSATSSFVGAAITLFGASTAWGGGAWLYEIASPDLGTASAGRAALAADASTAFGNPAGMTRLEGSQLLIGLQPLVVTTEFDVGTQTSTSGTNGGNAGGFIPAGGIYGVYGLRPDLKLGMAFNSYAGGALDYESNWVGRYYGTQSELVTFNLNPVVAYRVLDWLSLGAGVQWDVTDDYALTFAYEYASLGSNPINQTRGPLTGTLQGDYQTNSLNVFEVTVNHRL